MGNIIYVSEFLQLNENTGYFLRHEFLPQSWNNGIVERWNSGFSKDIIHFKLYRQDEFCYLPNIAVYSPSRRLYEPEAKTHFSLAQTEFTKCEFYALTFVRLNKK